MLYNSSGYKDEKDKEVQSVLRFIYGLKPDTAFTTKLETTVDEMKQAKSLKEGYMYLYEVIEEEKEIAAKQAAKEAAKEAKLQTLIELANKMIKAGKNSNKEISDFLSLPLDQVNALAKELTEKTE